MINQKIIFCSLLLQEFGYIQILDNPIVKKNLRYKYSQRLKYIRNQLIQISKDNKSKEENIIQNIDLCIDNVGLMASIVATLALIPESQIDFVEEEFSKICFRAINNHNTNEKKEKK